MDQEKPKGRVITFPKVYKANKKAARVFSTDELKRALDAAAVVIQEYNDEMNALEEEVRLYKEMTDRNTKYLLMLVQLLITHGVVPPPLDPPD